jgi:hypothetical protein
MRFSLKTLLVLFTAIPVAIAGLLYANMVWGALFYTAAFIILLTGIVGAIVRQGEPRAFWIGFAVFGMGYFCVALAGENGISRYQTNNMQSRFDPKLATSKLLVWSKPYLQRGAASNLTPASRAMFVSTIANDDYLIVGHSIFTVIIGMIGGWVGTLFSRVASRISEPEHGA